jgi:polynucleotide 5'-kinase involved in rRNA processing
MNRAEAEAAQPQSSASDPSDVPRLGLLQCPNAESLGWAPSEPNSAVTSDVQSSDEEMMPTSTTSLDVEVATETISQQQLSKSPMMESIDSENEQLISLESSPKRPRLDPTESATAAIPDGCTKDDTNAIHGPEHNLCQTQQKTISSRSEKSYDTKAAISVVLDYDTNSSDSLQDDGKRCQILTITLTPCGSNNNNNKLSNASILVGTISGKAKIELLPQSTESKSSSYSSIFLDVFGYRISCNTSGKDNSIVINRPDWMNAVPLTVITDNFTSENDTSPIVLRVKLHSIYEENTSTPTITEASNNENYYSAYAEESYNIKTLPPRYIYPGNDTLGGSSVTTILDQWKTTMDTIAKNLLIDETDTSQNRNSDRILICGAKGVGKSTMLRYATNRMISEQMKKDSCSADVAVLDLDCGQPELSVPGLITLSLVSKPLLSDPPMHMVCGGMDGDAMNNDEEEEDGKVHPLQHEAAYFFGDITSKADPDKYIEMATLLLHKYNDLKRERIENGKGNLPLLINTDGWVKGFGYEILGAIIEAVNPGNIIQMLGTTRTKSFDLPSQNTAAGASQTRYVHAVQSFDENMIVTPNDDKRSYRSMDSSNSTGPLQATASDHRNHRFCAYFMGGYNEMTSKRIHLGIQSETITFHREKGIVDPHNILGLTMASMPPYAVPFHSVSLYSPPGFLDGVTEVEPAYGTQGDFASEDVLDALNGSMVGLCCRGDVIGSTQSQSNSGVPNLRCVGLGIIRSIDRDRKLFFVLTPVHPSILSSVGVFVGGSIGLPLELVFRGANADSFPFLSEHSLATPSLGGDVMKSRNHSGRKKA